MRILPKNFFIKNLSALALRENFLIAAVGTIFAIRVFLKVTGYPSIGGSELHIAHLLWGGLFMFLAIFSFISFLSKSATQIGSILAGIGFGAFIDELGKFITRDNDYFFQPTFALIYAVFVCMYVGFKLVERQKATEKEYVINAVDMVKEAVINDLDHEEKEKALLYLKQANQKDPLVIALQEFLMKVETIPSPSPSLLIKLRHLVTTTYLRLARSPVFVRSLSIILLIQIAGVLVLTLYGPNHFYNLTFSEYGRLFSSIGALLFVIGGLISFVTSSRRLAYKYIKTAILIMLLLVQFFQFYDIPIAALAGIFLNGLLLLVVDYILEKETVPVLKKK